MVAGLASSQPTTSNDMGAIPAPYRPLCSALPTTAPLSTAAYSRHHLRQEPYAAILQVRICAGGRRVTVVPTATPIYPDPIYPKRDAPNVQCRGVVRFAEVPSRKNTPARAFICALYV